MPWHPLMHQYLAEVQAAQVEDITRIREIEVLMKPDNPDVLRLLDEGNRMHITLRMRGQHIDLVTLSFCLHLACHVT